jgi:ribosomal protein L7/L12
MSQDIDHLLKIAVRISAMDSIDKAQLVNRLLERQPQAFVELVDQVEMVSALAGDESPLQMSRYKFRREVSVAIKDSLNGVGDSVHDEIWNAVSVNHHVYAIKTLRQATGMSLVDAKRIIDRYHDIIEKVY